MPLRRFSERFKGRGKTYHECRSHSTVGWGSNLKLKAKVSSALTFISQLVMDWMRATMLSYHKGFLSVLNPLAKLILSSFKLLFSNTLLQHWWHQWVPGRRHGMWEISNHQTLKARSLDLSTFGAFSNKFLLFRNYPVYCSCTKEWI